MVKRCSGCRHKQELERLARVNNRKKLGLCVLCGDPRDSEHENCGKCRKMYSKRRNVAISKGLCGRCRTRSATEKNTLCSDCDQEQVNYREKIRQHIVKFKEENPTCNKCKNDFPYWLLEFNHIDPETKRYNIADCNSIKAFEAEQPLTELVCIMCHTEITADQNRAKRIDNPGYTSSRRRDRYEKINTIKLARGCEYPGCGFRDPKYPEKLHFDHIDRETKTLAIGRMIQKNLPWKKIEYEITLCRVLCCVHHRTHTVNQLGFHGFDLEENLCPEFENGE